MKAVVYNKKARPDRLVYCDIPEPVQGDNEVLVKVHAASANAADYRSMQLGIIPQKRIFGADIAGRVVSAGRNVRLLKPGDEVMGDLASFGFGGFAEYVTAPEEALVIKPSNLSFVQAAAVPLACLTALQAIRNKGNIEKGKRVLVVGSAGGVGTFTVQLAKYFGGIVTGICSPRNAEQTKSLGADVVIDYTKENFYDRNEQYDLIVAVNGSHSLLSYRKALAPNGIYVMVGGSLGQIFRSLLFGRFLSFGSRKMKTLSAKPVREDLVLISKLLEEGKIRPVIDKTYPLEKTAEALRYVSEGHARAKVVIIPQE